MGAGCSSSNATAAGSKRANLSGHHHENIKNRLNPTEKIENWKEKMLMDIGSDPLSVIRDFPRMNVFFIYEDAEKRALTQNRAYLKYTTPEDGDDVDDSGLEPSSDDDGTAAGASGGAQRRGASNESIVAVPMDSTGAATHKEKKLKAKKKNKKDASLRYSSWSSAGRPPRSNPLTPTANAVGINSNNSTTGCNNLHQNTTHQPSAVKRQVTMVERAHETKRFAARRRRLRATVLAITDLVGERDTFGKAFDTIWAEREREYYAGSTSGHTPAAPRRDSAPSLGGAARQRSASASGCLGSTAEHPSQVYTQGPDIHQFFQVVCIDSGMLQAVTSGFTSADTDAAAGNATGSHVRSSRAMSRVMPLLSTPSSSGLGFERANPTTPSTPPNLPSGKPEYIIHSATFHLMQYIVQGVMFFPFQRLKHLLWFPWSPNSLFSDVDWKVFVYVEKNVKSVSNFVFEKKLTHSAHKRVKDSASANNNATSRSNAGEAEYPTENSPLLGERAESTAASLCRPQYSSTGASKDLLVIKHLQIVQHYVDDSDEKVIPRYELDWTCAIYADRDKLKSVYPTPPSLAAMLPRHRNDPRRKDDLDSTDGGGERRREDHSPYCGSDSGFSMPPTPSPAAPAGLRGILGDPNAANDHSTSNEHHRRSERENAPAAAAPIASAPVSTPNFEDAVNGVRTNQQPQLVTAEVVFANVNVVGARVEAARRSFCGVPSEWARNTGELRYLLEDQYGVDLEEVSKMKRSRY